MPFPTTHPALERTLAVRGYAEPTPVQAAVIQDEAVGRDLLVSAQTGSGKTVAFGLAAAAEILGEAERAGQAGAPLCLVVAPTRELALQVKAELTWLYAEAGIRLVSCVGGMDSRAEQRALNVGAHIVVGTPGRLRDHIERGNLDLSALRVVVLDEADEMLDLGFREDLEFILDATPSERRTLLFSATIAKPIAALAKTYQRDAFRIDTVARNQPHADIEYRAIRVAPNEIEHAVVNVLRYFESPGALVFCATREKVRHLHASLRERGFEVVSLSGELTQKERSDALQALRDGRARVCVATDVAARGLDLPDLGLVIHAELPVNKAALTHRSGRTGRAGKKGLSVLLVPYTRRRKAELMLGDIDVEAQWSGPPSAEEIIARDKVRLLEQIAALHSVEEEAELVEAVVATLTPQQMAAAIIASYRAKLPAPEEVYDDARMRDAQTRPLRPKRDWDDRTDREPRERGAPRDHGADTDMAWFRLNLGRAKNADPKWLIPLICRLGHVTKKDIGAIRIFDRETKFEITREAEAKFLEAVNASEEKDTRIEPAAPPGPRKEFGAPRKDFGDRAERKPFGEKKPWADRKPHGEKKDFGDRPARPKRDFGPRPESAGDGDRPVKKPWVKKEHAPRDEAAPARPKRDFGPRDERPAKAFKPKAPRADAAYDPSAPKADRPKKVGGKKKGRPNG